MAWQKSRDDSKELAAFVYGNGRSLQAFVWRIVLEASPFFGARLRFYPIFDGFALSTIEFPIGHSVSTYQIFILNR